MFEAVISPDCGPPAGPYSPAIRAGGFLFISGQGPFDGSGNLAGGTFAEQAHVVFDNLEALARAAGADLGRVVRLGAFLNDLADFAQWNEVCEQRLSKPYPARTTVPAVLPRFALEVDAILLLEGAP
ncbi:RidA family protein [Nonomuraea sp. NPDC050540]|uniref:RidA family protein n=1 Tax=Nonomuraea sp. NPDC050540 TaxID=3364367 RepID=UPI0037A3455A